MHFMVADYSDLLFIFHLLHDNTYLVPVYNACAATNHQPFRFALLILFVLVTRHIQFDFIFCTNLFHFFFFSFSISSIYSILFHFFFANLLNLSFNFTSLQMIKACKIISCHFTEKYGFGKTQNHLTSWNQHKMPYFSFKIYHKYYIRDSNSESESGFGSRKNSN